MTILSLMEQSEIEREAAIVLMKSLMPERGGRRGIAEDLGGISETYVSMLWALDTAEHRRRVIRHWSDPVLQRIRKAPWPRETREQLEHHVQQSIKLREMAKASLRMSGRFVSEGEVRDVRDAHHRAMQAKSPRQHRLLLLAALNAGNRLMAGVRPEQQLMEHLELCFCINDIETMNNHPAAALVYAKQARLVLAETEDRLRTDAERERLQYIRVNVLRAEAIPRKNLGFSKDALALFEEADREARRLGVSRSWDRYISDDLLGALGERPRFSNALAESLVDRGVAAVPPEEERRTEVRLRFRLGMCYCRRGALRKAAKVFEDIRRDAQDPQLFGIQHRLRHQVGLAEYALEVEDHRDARKILESARTIAEEAGARHRLLQIKRLTRRL